MNVDEFHKKKNVAISFFAVWIAVRLEAAQPRNRLQRSVVAAAEYRNGSGDQSSGNTKSMEDRAFGEDLNFAGGVQFFENNKNWIEFIMPTPD